MSDLQEIPKRDILDYIKAYSHKFNGCLTGEVFQDAIKEIERLRKFLNEMSVIASYSGWVKVDDCLPYNIGYYLTYSPSGGIWASEYGVTRQKLEFRDAIGFPLYPKPTHWMPLPSAPKQVREDER